MKRNYFFIALLLGLAACSTLNHNKNQVIKPTNEPAYSSTPINISTREQRITIRQSTGNYKSIPLSVSVSTDLYLTLSAATAPAERSIKTNDETKLKFISTEKKTLEGTETWVFKAVEKGEFELSFLLKQAANGKEEAAEIFKMTIR